jgi:hypothetical protein
VLLLLLLSYYVPIILRIARLSFTFANTSITIIRTTFHSLLLRRRSRHIMNELFVEAPNVFVYVLR